MKKMSNNPTALPRNDMGDKELALWMLERMKDSQEFLGVIQKARIAGTADVLDTPDYVGRHKQRLRQLYQSDTEGEVSTTATTAAKIEALMKRDIEKHGSEGLPREWQTTVAAARDEIEGKTSGAFDTGFTAGLATAAREELTKLQSIEKGRDVGRDGP
jgi:hypothetical protein